MNTSPLWFALAKAIFSLSFIGIYMFLEPKANLVGTAHTFAASVLITVFMEVVLWATFEWFRLTIKTHWSQILFVILLFAGLFAGGMIVFQSVTEPITVTAATILSSVLGAIFASGVLDFVKTALNVENDTKNHRIQVNLDVSYKNKEMTETTSNQPVDTNAN